MLIKYVSVNSSIKQGIKKGEKKGLEEGIKQGIERGKAELLTKQIMKKFKKIPGSYKEKIKSLPDESLDLIAMDIFEINSLDELERYF